MNKNEKKSLFSFLLIYAGSTVLMLGVLLYSYYINELQALDTHCTIQMQSAANKIRGDILKAYMDKKTFNPSKLKENSMHYGLFSKDKKKIYSNLFNKNLKFNNTSYFNDTHSFHISTIDENMGINIKYIIIETDQLPNDVKELKLIMISILIFSSIFIIFIGYFLAKLLLKPIRNKFEVLDNFIKDSAHELNTPVSILLASSSTLKQGRHEKKMLKYIISSAKQISHIYNDIHFLAFDEKNISLDEIINLDELIYECIDFYKDIALIKNIKIITKLEKTIILIDKMKMQKILNNLLSNAIKYSKKNGQIIISIKDNTLSIQDFGIGIKQEDQKMIFKRYKRGDNNEGGFGIGLDIVSKVVKEYNLTLHLNSKLQKGSTFLIDIKNILK